MHVYGSPEDWQERHFEYLEWPNPSYYTRNLHRLGPACYYNNRLIIMTVMDDTVGGILGSLYAQMGENGVFPPVYDTHPTNQVGDRIDPTENGVLTGSCS